MRPLVTSRALARHHRTMRVERAAQVGAKESLKNFGTSDGVFEDMQASRRAQLDAICPRFVPPAPTDWTRTGLGGDGVDARSGAFLAPGDRFSTTSNAYFKPLVYAPNKPVSRDAISDAAREGLRRSQVKVARRARALANHEAIAEMRLFDEQMRRGRRAEAARRTARPSGSPGALVPKTRARLAGS